MYLQETAKFVLLSVFLLRFSLDKLVYASSSLIPHINGVSDNRGCVVDAFINVLLPWRRRKHRRKKTSATSAEKQEKARGC